MNTEALRFAIRKSRTDPSWFFKNIMRIELDPWQLEVVEALADVWRKKNGLPTKYNHKGLNKITVRAMHGPGKTFGAACCAHWFGFCFRGKIPCTAPKEMQLLTRLWPEFRKVRRMAPQEYQMLMDVQASRVTWCGDPDWMMIAETASTPENLAGYHDEYLLFICEEASGIPEEMFPVIEGALSVGKMVCMIMIGNPTNNSGTFYMSHNVEKVAKNYYKMHVSLDKTNRAGLAEWVKEMEDKYGANSPVVKVRCYGEFADLDEGQLVPLGWLERMIGTDKELRKAEHPKLRVSVDVSDGGEDMSVITIARHYQSHIHVIHQSEYSFPPSEAPLMTADQAIQLFREYGGNTNKGDDFVVDSIGVGAGTAGYLMKKKMSVVQYRGGESSDDPNMWRNRRTQSYIMLRDLLRERRITVEENAIDDWDSFVAQVCSIHTRPSTDKVDDIETKVQMKNRGVKSPDRADSIVMQFATSRPAIGYDSDSSGLAYSRQGVASNASW